MHVEELGNRQTMHHWLWMQAQDDDTDMLGL